MSQDLIIPRHSERWRILLKFLRFFGLLELAVKRADRLAVQNYKTEFWNSLSKYNFDIERHSLSTPSRSVYSTMCL